ncbi:MAG: NAD(P)H-hydrate epimerase, partial [Candidatus Omnitrophica bacterium]|nr:NAD(P)H-hydrate epimerase [Candidatus Omnitrophota bacterium]
ANFDILRRIGKKVVEVEAHNLFIFKKKILRYNLIVDALLGVGLRGGARGIYKEMIECVNSSGVPVISVDVPSGLDADTGEAPGACVKARETVTFIAAKRGMFIKQGPRMCGRIVVDTLGVPFSAVKSLAAHTNKGE